MQKRDAPSAWDKSERFPSICAPGLVNETSAPVNLQPSGRWRGRDVTRRYISTTRLLPSTCYPLLSKNELGSISVLLMWQGFITVISGVCKTYRRVTNQIKYLLEEWCSSPWNSSRDLVHTKAHWSRFLQFGHLSVRSTKKAWPVLLSRAPNHGWPRLRHHLEAN